MTVKELFDFVIDPSIADEDVDEYLGKVSAGFHQHVVFLIFEISILMMMLAWNKL